MFGNLAAIPVSQLCHQIIGIYTAVRSDQVWLAVLTYDSAYINSAKSQVFSII